MARAPAVPVGEVVCIGGAVVDRKFHLLAPAVPHTSNPARGAVSYGGVARNVAENLARLGVAVRLVSAVGDDEAGRSMLAHLSAAGVGVDAVRTVAGCGTAEYVAVLDPDGELRLGLAAMEVLHAVGPAEVDASWPTAGWVVADANLQPATLRHLLARARSAGSAGSAGSAPRLVLDAVSVPKVVRLPHDLDGAAVLCCNLDEARAWLAASGRDGQGAPAQLAARLRAAGAAAVVLTRGAGGVTVADRTGIADLPAVQADVVDVTGAGDALVAGTVAGLAEGLPLAAAARRGTLAAAMTIEVGETVRPDLCLALARRERGRR